MATLRGVKGLLTVVSVCVSQMNNDFGCIFMSLFTYILVTCLFKHFTGFVCLCVHVFVYIYVSGSVHSACVSVYVEARGQP